MVNIEIKNLTKSFGNTKVLSNIDLTINQSDVVSIIGPSGSGKSTLLRSVQGLEPIDDGNILLNGDRINKSNNKKIGMVFQNFNLFPHKTVLENVIEAPIMVGKIKRQKATNEALVLLDKVGLADKVNSYPSQLSGGQKQRVAIARALAMKPEILLFDEPTSALDPELVGEVLTVIRGLAKENITMLIVTHEMNFAREVSDYVVFMDKGKILEKQPPKELFESPKNVRVKSFIDKVL